MLKNFPPFICLQKTLWGVKQQKKIKKMAKRKSPFLFEKN